jgi:hypothetical protein
MRSYSGLIFFIVKSPALKSPFCEGAADTSYSRVQQPLRGKLRPRLALSGHWRQAAD